MFPPFRMLLCFTAAALTTVAPVLGQLIVSNLDQPNDTGSGTVGIDKWAAQAFSTPGTASTLDSVGLKLAHDTSALGTYTVSLWDASGTGATPGTLIASISSGNAVSGLTTSFVDYFFTAPPGITLAANTTYFIVLNSTAAASPAGLL